MAQRLLTPNPENASIIDLKGLVRVGSGETALRCTAIQMLIVGITREQVCQALLVTDRALRKWINAFNRRGVDGLIANKRPGRTALIGTEQAEELTTVVDHPVQAGRTFWTAKAFHGYTSEAYPCPHLPSHLSTSIILISAWRRRAASARTFPTTRAMCIIVPFHTHGRLE